MVQEQRNAELSRVLGGVALTLFPVASPHALSISRCVGTVSKQCWGIRIYSHTCNQVVITAIHSVNLHVLATMWPIAHLTFHPEAVQRIRSTIPTRHSPC